MANENNKTEKQQAGKDGAKGGKKAKKNKETKAVEEKRSETVQQIEHEVINSIKKPIQYLDDTLEKEQAKQKDTFRELLAENAKLEIEKTKLENKLEQSKAEIEQIKAALAEEKAATKGKDEKVAAMEKEVKLLLQARKNKDFRDEAKKIRDKHNPPTDADPTIYDPNERDDRVRELQLRLKRITLESREKDARVEELAEELKLTQEFAQELQALVDEQRALEVKEKVESDKSKRKNMNYYDPANVITTGHVEKSEVCTIQ